MCHACVKQTACQCRFKFFFVSYHILYTKGNHILYTKGKISIRVCTCAHYHATLTCEALTWWSLLVLPPHFCPRTWVWGRWSRGTQSRPSDSQCETRWWADGDSPALRSVWNPDPLWLKEKPTRVEEGSVKGKKKQSYINDKEQFPFRAILI